MRSQFRHIIDGQVVTEPDGWEDIAQRIKRDFERRIIYVEYPLTLTFPADGYRLLRNIFRRDRCRSLRYVLQERCSGDAWKNIVSGRIIVADTNFNVTRCTAEATVVDDGAGAALLSGWSIPAFPEANESRNGVPITAAPPLTIEIFNPTAPLPDYLPPPRTMWDVMDFLRTAVAFISDGRCSVVSDWYDNLPDDERIAILLGIRLRILSGPYMPPSASVGDIMTFLCRAFNLWGGIYSFPDGTATLRLEPAGYWYGAAIAHSDIEVGELSAEIATDRLYSTVQFGSKEAISNRGFNPALSLPFFPLRGFSEEVYHTLGECSQDRKLDLTLPFVVCTNAIQNSRINGSTTNDNRVFAIQYDRTLLRAVKGDYLTSGLGPYLYNEILLNGNVAARWNVGADLSQILAPQGEMFRAERTADDALQNIGSGISFFQLQYDDDYNAPNFDQGNDYGNGTTQGNPVSQANSRYTAVVQGAHGFEATIVFNLFMPTPGVAGVTLVIERYNSANTLVGPGLGPTVTYNQSGTYTLTWSVTHPNMNVGDYVIVRCQVTNQSGNTNKTFTPLATRYFRSTFTPSWGGFIQSEAPIEPLVVLKGETYISRQQWDNLRQDYRGAIRLGTNGIIEGTGHMSGTSYRLSTGITEVEIITP